MNESEWNTIYRNLSLKDTDDLIGYWRKHDENEWTAIAFDVMEKILIERLGELPNKDDVDISKFNKILHNQKTNIYTELKALINDNDPVFYDPKKVSLLVKWIFRCMNILIVFYIAQFIFENVSLFRVLLFEVYGMSSLIIDLIFGILGLLIVIVMIFIQYKALGYVLKILREMEINSRKKYN